MPHESNTLAPEKASSPSQQDCAKVGGAAPAAIMKALVYHGPGKKAFEDHAKPVIIEPTDAIVKITKTTICGTDLHILKGGLPSCTPGRILGHEGVGVIEQRRNCRDGLQGRRPGAGLLRQCLR
jgi:threonine dehydrogenase-like Zn-dependent dehydrogenase